MKHSRNQSRPRESEYSLWFSAATLLFPVPELAHPEAAVHHAPAATPRRDATRAVVWLGSITLAWKLVECGVSAYAAFTAHSPALLAFGSDSVVELISALVVLSQWGRGNRLSEHRAARLAGALLSFLAVVVAGASIGSIASHIHPDTSRSGMAITLASLIVMPVLAYGKRREAQRIGNAALAADAVQSATCAYLALLTLLGLGANALFGIGWFDNLAALVAVPILLREARIARRGHLCAAI